MNLLLRIFGKGGLAGLLLLNPFALGAEAPVIQDSTQVCYAKRDSAEVRKIIREHWDICWEGEDTTPDIRASRLNHKHAIVEVNTEFGRHWLEKIGYRKVEGDTLYVFTVSEVGSHECSFCYLSIPKSRFPCSLDDGYRTDFENSD